MAKRGPKPRPDKAERLKCFGVWWAMVCRCENKNVKQYKDYGGRGIRVCTRWREKFQNFVDDMGYPPKGMTLDRKKNDGDYCAENCKWSTRLEQANNKRGLRLYTYKGETKSLRRWCVEYGKEYLTVYSRIASGWSFKEAITKTIDVSKRNQLAKAKGV